MKPVFYVIIPCYNVEKYLQKCADSLKAQTYQNYYAVMIDDGSSDHTLQLCQEIASENENFIVLRNEQNSGLEATRNKALDYIDTFREEKDIPAEDLWICFLDADDTFRKEAFEDIVNALEPSVDFVLTGLEFEYEDHSDFSRPGIPDGIHTAAEVASHVEREIPWECVSCIGTKFYRYSFLGPRNLRFESYYRYNEDGAFALQLFSAAKHILVLNECEYRYLQREGSIMHSYRKDMYTTLNHVARLYESYYEKFGLDRTYLVHNNRMIIAWGSMIDELSAGREQFSLFFDRIVNDTEAKESFRKVLKSKEASRQERLLAYGLLHKWKHLIEFYIRARFLK